MIARDCLDDARITTKQALINALRDIAARQDVALPDVENDHAQADDLIIAFINDDEIRVAYESIRKWYA